MSLYDYNRRRTEGAQAAAVIVIGAIVGMLIIAALAGVMR